MKNFIYIGASLDGYIAELDDGIDWLDTVPNPEQSDLGFSVFMDQIDAVLMGRKTFEVLCSFDVPWPYPKPVFILSNTLKTLPTEYQNKAKLVKGPIKKLLSQLNSDGIQNIYVDGGATIQSFLKQDLIDEMIVTRIPILLGDGVPLFSKMDNKLWFEHVKTEVLLGELVKSHYRRKRDQS